MKQLVVKLLSLHRDAQAVQVHEVKGHHITGSMNLREHNFLLYVMLESPFVYTTFQGSSQGVGYHQLGRFATWLVVFLLEPTEQRNGLQTRVRFQQRFDLWPERFQRVDPCAMGPR